MASKSLLPPQLLKKWCVKLCWILSTPTLQLLIQHLSHMSGSKAQWTQNLQAQAYRHILVSWDCSLPWTSLSQTPQKKGEFFKIDFNKRTWSILKESFCKNVVQLWSIKILLWKLNSWENNILWLSGLQACKTWHTEHHCQPDSNVLYCTGKKKKGTPEWKDS